MRSKSADVILVDNKDRPIGTMEKHEAHLKGKRHRAFSVFIFNSQGQILLQKRAKDKYHSGGLWSNTCCSHPQPGETTLEAAHRRLIEEMGIACELEEQFSFIYRTQFNNRMTEYEYDHVLFGINDSDPSPDPDEAADWKWKSVPDVSRDIEANPDDYTFWFGLIWKKVAGSVGPWLDSCYNQK